MSIGGSADRLEALGFRRVGHLHYHMQLEVWWSDDKKLQLLLWRCGSHAIVRGSKHYFVRAVSASGETWARDVGLLHDYLENHFPEFRVSFSFFRDVTGRLAEQHVRQKTAAEAPSVVVPTARELGRLQAEAHRQSSRHGLETLASMFSGASKMLQDYLRSSTEQSQRDAEQKAAELERARGRAQVFEELQRRYAREGSAANFVFSLCSGSHASSSDDELLDAVNSISKELLDADRYEVSQKLGQGRLNIQVAAAGDPSWAWVEEWLGGALTPRQLQKLEGPLTAFRDRAEQRLMVTPDENIVVDGHVKEDQKLLGARVLGSLLGRIDTPDDRESEDREVEARHLPANVGQTLQNGKAVGPCELPLAKLEHLCVSGSTGAGKSWFVRVLVEEAARHSIGVLVLDPRNQAAGLLVPEDREELLSLYAAFKIDRRRARAFPFLYSAPGERIGQPLPADLGSIATGLHVVSFKGLDEGDRCALFAQILEAVFLASTREESTSLRLLLVVEEAQLFTRRRVGSEARDAGARAENALDRIVREGRKYGLCVAIASQSIKDFSHDVASIRQNTNTKVFFRNADREVEYAHDFLGDGRKIIGLPPGTCMLHNASLGVLTVKVRPPFSKLWEFSSADTRRLLQPDVRASRVSEEAQRVLHLVRQHHAQHGCGLNLSELAEQAGITSKRRLLQLLEELERSDAVRTKKLRERGQPRIVEPIASSSSPQAMDRTRTEGEPNVAEGLCVLPPASPTPREDEK